MNCNEADADVKCPNCDAELCEKCDAELHALNLFKNHIRHEIYTGAVSNDENSKK